MYTCVYMCIHVYTYIYICIYVYSYMYVYMYVYVCIYICINIHIYIYIYSYMYIWAAEVIWYKTQLTGCSYLVLQSRHVLGGLTSFSNAALVFNSQMLYVRCLPRSRGVPTSFYRLIMIFLTNRGTPQYYSLFNQIKSVAHIQIWHMVSWSQAPPRGDVRLHAGDVDLFPKLPTAGAAPKTNDPRWWFRVENLGMIDILVIFSMEILGQSWGDTWKMMQMVSNGHILMIWWNLMINLGTHECDSIWCSNGLE